MKSKRKYLLSEDGESLQIQVPNLSTLQSASLSFTSGDRVNFSVSANNLEQAESGRRQCSKFQEPVFSQSDVYHESDFFHKKRKNPVGDGVSEQKGFPVSIPMNASVDMAGRRFSSSHHDCNEQLIFMVDEIFSGFGFVRFDLVFRNQIGFQIPEEWPAKAFTVQYTHSKLLCNDDDEVVVADYVSVRFQRCGHLVNVYGCLNNSSSEVYHMCLNGPRQMWENYDNKKRWRILYSESWKSNPKDFRKNVKDKLAFPLLIDVCYSSGMDLPSCFMTLPAVLKVKIMESLRGADIAKMECVCKEMQSLSLSLSSPTNFLWKQKFEEEITFLAGINLEEEEAEAEIDWKLHFVFAKGYEFLRLLHCPSYPYAALALARARARSGRYNNYVSHPRPWDFRWDL